MLRNLSNRDRDRPIELLYRDPTELATHEYQHTLADFAAPGTPELHDALMEKLDRLPPWHRDVLEEYYLKGRTQNQMAETYGLTQGAVNRRIQRARIAMTFYEALPPNWIDLIKAVTLPESKQTTTHMHIRIDQMITQRTADALIAYMRCGNQLQVTQEPGRRWRTAIHAQCTMSLFLRKMIYRVPGLKPLLPAIKILLNNSSLLSDPKRSACYKSFGKFSPLYFRSKKKFCNR